MEMRRGAMAAVVAVVTLLSALMSPAAGEPVIIKLGFLTPYPALDSAVPLRLADEWISAMRVALEVLGEQHQKDFLVEPYVQNSDCTRESAEDSAARLVRVGVVAVVGPACSEAAVGAATILGKAGIPLISFAATYDELSNRLAYPTFFRTVVPDVEQTKAIISAIEFFEWKQVTVMYSDEAYGNGLVSNIMASANQAPVTITPVKIPVIPPEAGYESLGIFNHVTGDNNGVMPVIVAATPLVAENIFIAAYANGTLTAPWWYLATDGATAFDLIGEGDQLTLAEAMQGELGVYPSGNFADDSAIQPFLTYWKNQTYSSYPGLLTLPASPKYTRPRAYVPHLLDAIQAVYNAFTTLVAKGTDVTASAMLTQLADTNFVGSSGPISFNNGERVITGGLGSEFDFVQPKGATWQPAGVWTGTSAPSFSLVAELERPGVSGTQQTTSGTVTVAAAPTNLTSSTLDGSSNVVTEPTTPQEFQGTAFAPGATPVEDPLGATPSQIAELSGKSGGGSTSGGTIAAIVVPVTLVGLAAGAFVYYKFFRPSGDPQFVRML